MADRTDIDALLISALYGELTPADEARLTAHLESHPADRTALADLTHTRATVRESRSLAVQFEPPQSVSALLLQEAARRAPKQEREVAGWFHRFTRSFMMHPAMAAAAMLVLVVGVAGTLYVRRGDQFVEASAPAAIDELRARNVAQSQAAAEPMAGTAEIARGVTEDKGNGPTGGFGSAAGSDSYRVALDEPAAEPRPALRDDRQGGAGRAKDETDLLADGEGNRAKNKANNQAKEDRRGGDQAPGFAQPAKPTVRPSVSPKLAKKGAGLELRSRELEPKDFDDERPEKPDAAKREIGNAEGDRASITIAGNTAQAPSAAMPVGGRATAVPSMRPQQDHAAAPAPAADPGAVAPITPSNDAKLTAPAKTASRSPQGPAPSPQPSPPPSLPPQPSPSPSPPPPAAAALPSAPRDNRRQADKPMSGAVAARPADEKTADDRVLTEWARKQREQVLAFVKANNCRAAANAAVAIYNRAPDYYAASIATDRAIKPCLAYVNNEREREDRSRAAAKRANAADTPAPAAPPPARK